MGIIKIDILSQKDLAGQKKADIAEYVIRQAAKVTKIEVQITRTSNFAAYSAHAINPSQTPVIIVNGNVEFAGRAPEPDAFRKRLAQIKNLSP